MTTTTREQAIIAAAASAAAGSSYTGLHFPPGQDPFKGAAVYPASRIAQGYPYVGGPLSLDPHSVVFEGQSREGDVLIHGADILVEGYSTSSTTGADLTAAGSTLDDTTKDFVVAGVAVDDVVIINVAFWLGTPSNYRIYKVTAVAATSLTLDPPVAADETGTVSYVVARLAPKQIYTFPDSNEAAPFTAFQEQTFALTDVFAPGTTPAPSSFVGTLGTTTGVESVVLPQWPHGVGGSSIPADRADAPFLGPGGTATTAIPLPHANAGFRVILYPDDGSGSAPDLTKPIVMEEPIIDPAIPVEDQWIHIDPRGFIRLSHPPKPGSDIRPNAEGYSGVLRLYAVWYTYLGPSAQFSRGMTVIRPSDSYLLHPSYPGFPAEATWKDDLTTGQGIWFFNPAIFGSGDLDYGLGITGEARDETDTVLTGRIGIGAFGQTTAFGPDEELSSLYTDHLWGGWLFAENTASTNLSAELGPRESQLVVGDGFHTRGDFWPLADTAHVAAAVDASRVTAVDKPSTAFGTLWNTQLLRELVPGDVTWDLTPGMRTVRRYTGGTVRLRQGVYWVDSTIEIPPGVRLIGDGDGTILRAAPELGDDPIVRFGPFTAGVGGMTPFPDANVQPLVAYTGSYSYDGATPYTSSAGDFAGMGCDVIYNERYDRFAVVWTEDTDGAGDHHVYFAELDLEGTMLTDIGATGTPAPVQIDITGGGSPNPPLSGGRPRIDWHPLLNTYIIVWIGEDAAQLISMDFWESRRDVTIDGRPGSRAGATTGLNLHTSLVSDTLSSLSVKWFWGSQVSGQERRFAVAWINDDGSGVAGGNHLDFAVADVTESVVGGGWDTPGLLSAADPTESLVLASDTLESCDLIYNGSPDVFYLAFTRRAIGGGGDDAIHLAIFDPSAITAVSVDARFFDIANGWNVALVVHSDSFNAYPALEGAKNFRQVKGVVGHNEIKLAFYTNNRLLHASVPLGYNPNVGPLDPTSWPTDTVMTGFAGTTWSTFADNPDYRGFAFPTMHGGRRGESGHITISPWRLHGTAILSDSEPPSIIFDGTDYVLGVVSTSNTPIIAVVSGETGEVLQTTEGTLFASALLTQNLALASTPYRYFGVLGLETSSGDLHFEIASSLNFKSELRDLKLVGSGHDTYQVLREPFVGSSFQARDGARSTERVDGFTITHTGDEVAPDRFTSTSGTFSTKDIGKRLVITAGSGAPGSVFGSPNTYVITDLITGTTVQLSPAYGAGVQSTGVTARVGLFFEKRFGGARIASNGYVTCLVAVTGNKFDTSAGVGGGLHFMMMPNDQQLSDINGSDNGGICLQREGVAFADVVWTGELFRIYYLMAEDGGSGRREYHVRRIDVSPNGEIVPTNFADPAGPTAGGADIGATFARRISRKLTDPSDSVSNEMDLAEFRACYNGRNVALCVYGTDRTGWTGLAGDAPTAFMRYLCVTPDFLGSEELDLVHRYQNSTHGTQTVSVYLVTVDGAAGTTNTGAVSGGGESGNAEAIFGGGADRSAIITMDPGSTSMFEVGDVLTFSGAGTGTVDSVVALSTRLISTKPIFREEHVGAEVELFNHAGPAANDTIYNIARYNSPTSVDLAQALDQADYPPEDTDIRLRMVTDLSLVEWRSFDGGSQDPGDEVFALGGDLIWNGNEFVSLLQYSFDGTTRGRIVWGAFRDTDGRVTRDPRFIPSTSAITDRTDTAGSFNVNPLYQLNVSGAPWSFSTNPIATPLYWFADTTAGSGLRAGDPSIPSAEEDVYSTIGALGCSIAFNPIDRIYAIAYVGQYRGFSAAAGDPDFNIPQVMVEYFEENGVPLSFNPTDTTAFKGERRMLVFGGKDNAVTDGFGADSPTIIWSGTHFALTFNAYEVTGAVAAPVANTSHVPLHILSPKEPGILHSSSWTNRSSVNVNVFGKDMIYDPVSGDFFMVGVTQYRFDYQDSYAVTENRHAVLRRLSPKHLVQIAGASGVKVKGVTFSKSAGSVRFDTGLDSSGMNSRIPDKGDIAPNGSDPVGMSRVMRSICLEDLDQRGCVVASRMLDRRGVDDVNNLNMNGK